MSDSIDQEAQLREDGLRFQALMRCPQIKMQGSAGFDPQTGERRRPDLPGCVHFGAEFWPIPSRDFKTGEVVIYSDATPEKSRWGHHALKALADDIIASETKTGYVHQSEQKYEDWNARQIDLNRGESEIARIIFPFLREGYTYEQVLEASEAFITSLENKDN